MRRHFTAARAMRRLALFLVAGSASIASHADVSGLPFAFQASEEKVDPLPEYMSANRPAGEKLRPVKIGDDVWIIGQNAPGAPVVRYKGTTVEDGVRQPDGAAIFPVGGTIRGGMWYDAATQTLYTPVEVTTPYYSGRDRHEIDLASSADQGLTWKYLGPILTNPAALGTKQAPEAQSGPYWDAGDSDPFLYVDFKERYAYLFTRHFFLPKIGATVAPLEENRVARCSLDDELAPAHWRKWFDGAWSEPGVGGEGTAVNARVITYNAILKKFLAFNGGSSLATCDDLEKQDWSPAYQVGEFWHQGPGWTTWTTDDSKADLVATSANFYVYSLVSGQAAKRFNCQVNTAPASGQNFTLVTPMIFAWVPVAQAAPVNSYGFAPLLDSSDSVMARRTRRVPAASTEMTYQGAWTDEADPQAYQGAAKSADAKGAAISFAFHGQEIYWRVTLGPHQGMADVFLDGKLATTVDCWAAKENSLAMVFMRRNLPDRDHVIRVVVRGEKNALSDGTEIRHECFEYGAETWRASDDFISVAGKNQWSNLERNGSSYDDLTFTAPFWSSGDGCQVGFTRMTSGTGDATRKWTAPHDGTVRIEGTPTLRGAFSDELDVSVLRDEANAWTAALVPGKTSAACDVNVPVKKGNALYFIVHCSAPPSDVAPGLEVLDGRKTLRIDAPDHGLAFNAASRVVVHLAKPARSLTAPCALDDQADAAAIASPFRIKVEGQALDLAKNQTFGESPMPIDLNGATDFEIDGSPHVVLSNVVITLLDGTQVKLATLPLQDPHDGPPSVDWDPAITYVK